MLLELLLSLTIKGTMHLKNLASLSSSKEIVKDKTNGIKSITITMAVRLSSYMTMKDIITTILLLNTFIMNSSQTGRDRPWCTHYLGNKRALIITLCNRFNLKQLEILTTVTYSAMLQDTLVLLQLFVDLLKERELESTESLSNITLLSLTEEYLIRSDTPQLLWTISDLKPLEILINLTPKNIR